jgi:outer membrane protein assembly factor BamB
MRPMGAAPFTDKTITPFYANRETAWRDFRLGGGLDPVVVNPDLPRAPSWSFSAGSTASKGISSSPVVYRNLVLVASNDGSLYAIDAATGKLRWRYYGADELMTQPVYADGIAIVASGNAGCYVCLYPNVAPAPYTMVGTGLNIISAVDLRDGKERWRQRIAGTGMPTGAIVGSKYIHADGTGAVIALDARNGRLLWATRLPSSFAMSSVADGGDGNVYVAGWFTTGVYALRASDGAVVWRHMFSKYYTGTGDGPIPLANGAIISQYLERIAPKPPWGWQVWMGSRVRQHVFALDSRNGKLLWDRVVATGEAAQWNNSAIPLVYRRRLYIGSAVAPIVTCLDAKTGKISWQRGTDAVVKGGIAALDGVLYFGDEGGYLWALDASTGRMIGRLHEPVHFRVGSPVIVNGSLVDGSREGTVIAVPLRAIQDGHAALPKAARPRGAL